MKDLEMMWRKTEYGRKEGHRLHMAAVLAERRAEERRVVRPVVRPAVTLAALGFKPIGR